MSDSSPTVPPSPWQLPSPQLQWEDSGAPRSGAFGDIYFSRDNGLAETDHVFLQQNRLAERWRALDPARPGLFTIAETGFGTGLNVLAAWRLWRETAPAGWRLQFISVELMPLARPELQRALAQWPQLKDEGEALQAVYPPRLPGFHWLDLAADVRLLLVFAEASQGLDALLDSAATELPQPWQVDAWFLDGFAPAKNPAMWTEPLFNAIGRLSAPGTTFATFTAAGQVKRGLAAVGFAVEKVPGFGSKREMLRGKWKSPPDSEGSGGARVAGKARQDVAPRADTGTYVVACPGGPCPTGAPAQTPMQPAPIDYWAAPPNPLEHQRVVVIGGGLAGTATALALARRGWPVTLLEAAPRLATGASGNAQGVLYTKLSHRHAPLNQFALSSYLHALRHYHRLRDSGALPTAAAEFCGVLQLAESAEQWQLLRDAFAGHDDWVRCLDPDAAAQIAGCPLDRAALWFPQAGWLSPAQVCAAQAASPLIDVRCDWPVAALAPDSNGWRLLGERGDLTAGAVVVATAFAARTLLPEAELPLKPIRGQVTELPARWLRQSPATVICHDGYLAPSPAGAGIHRGGIHLGATFDLGDTDTTLRSADHRRNLDALAQALPGVLAVPADAIPIAELEGRAGVRCATPDYLPMVGAVPDRAALRERFAPLAKNARARVSGPGAWRPGLYLNVGHGSRGLTSTPLCAELLAALIAGEPRPLPRALVQALSPARFTARALIRGR